MISINKFYEYRGLSTDTKPTKALNGCKNGDCFIEMDTGKVYFYSDEDELWLEFGSNESSSQDNQVPSQDNQVLPQQ